MTKTRSLLFVVASLAMANAALFFTLSHNLSAGVYPIDADSIGLPLAGGAVLSGMLLVLLGAAIFVPKPGVLGCAIAMVLGGIAAIFSIAAAVSWAMPRHYTIAIAYAGVAVVCAILTVGYFRRLVSKVHW